MTGSISGYPGQSFTLINNSRALWVPDHDSDQLSSRRKCKLHAENPFLAGGQEELVAAASAGRGFIWAAHGGGRKCGDFDLVQSAPSESFHNVHRRLARGYD